MTPVEFVLNGTSHRVETRPGETLLEALRNRCGILSTKDGCQPQGQCGCCLILIDGNPKVSCAMPAEAAAGHEITTLEGIPEEEKRLIARCFVATAGLQCGFCIPGIALRAHHLTQKNPSPTRAEIARAIDGHLCRCTGYVKIVDAIELASKVLAGAAELPDGDWSGKVGTSLPKYEAEELALGDRKYIDDLTVPEMLHGAVVLSAHPRARVRAIDAAAARALPGVRAIVSAADVPDQR